MLSRTLLGAVSAIGLGICVVPAVASANNSPPCYTGKILDQDIHIRLAIRDAFRLVTDGEVSAGSKKTLGYDAAGWIRVDGESSSKWTLDLHLLSWPELMNCLGQTIAAWVLLDHQWQIVQVLRKCCRMFLLLSSDSFSEHLDRFFLILQYLICK